MKHIMLDLETMGNKPGCAILSIGAVDFGQDSNKNWFVGGNNFYSEINLQSCIDAGLKIDASTLVWWLKQDKEAQRVVFGTEKARALGLVLMEFHNWVKEVGGIYPWSCGADFDLPILTAAYETARTGCRSINVTEFGVPWLFWNSRCYRTLKSLSPIKAVDTGVAHNALDDAKKQALHAVAILNSGFKAGEE